MQVSWSVQGMLAGLLMFGYANLAVAAPDYLTSCPLKKGDSVEKVKQFYRTGQQPTPAPEKLKAFAQAYRSFYRFSQYGVWIFFDSAGKIQSLRFDHPFAGKIDGVAIGDSKQDVLRLKGEPHRQMEGLPDMEALAYRKKRKQEIIDNLPDPASKELVRAAVKEMEQIDERSLPFNTAWVYKVPGRDLLRYDFGSLSDKVQTILTDKGTEGTTPKEGIAATW